MVGEEGKVPEDPRMEKVEVALSPWIVIKGSPWGMTWHFWERRKYTGNHVDLQDRN